ncbi:MAG: penicillin-binding transpeptidase domain-containing protein, partial [Ruminococcus sp.]
GTIDISAHRGSIYDTNGTPLARSASVYKVYLDPKQFRIEIDELQERIDEENEEKKNGTYKAPEPRKDENGNEIPIVPLPVTAEAYKQETVKLLSEKLGISIDDVESSMEENSQYSVLQTQVEKPVADEVLAHFDKYDFTSIHVEEDTKRYYPQNELAAQVIGFTSGDGSGAYGVEAYYDEYLSGTDGKVISAKDSNGREMPYKYSKTYPAQNGNDIYLTIDATLQHYLEKHLQEMVDEFEVKNRACGIIMNVNTGAILAMASCPSFDLNNPYDISDPDSANEIAKLTGDARKTLLAEEREAQWKNKPIAEINEAGSVFKIITSASGIEENLVDVNGDSFYCSGRQDVADRTGPNGIGCHNLSGHGQQTFVEAITNSCNPAFMQIGARLGVDKFFYYLKSFGLTEKTGIDLPGESVSYCKDGSEMSEVDLAVTSFGQSWALTPMELVVACSASINGGYVLEPYVVSKILDEDGNVVLENERTIKRQVISEDTSSKMRDVLEKVVEGNTSGNVYIKGYRIGGKSGTAQKLGMTTENGEDEYVSSYLCFAPANDPEIMLYVMADMPNKEIAYYGSKVAVPTARKIMEDVLPELGYYPEYDESEFATLDQQVPFVTDKSVSDARATVEAKGFKCEVIGNGDTVTAQSPLVGTSIAYTGTVFLYTDDDPDAEMTEVPAVEGISVKDADDAMNYSGLNYVATGASLSEEGAVVKKQSIPAGTQVPKGTVIELEFHVDGAVTE